MRILVVEDDEDLSEAIVEALEDDAYAVDLAATGDEAERQEAWPREERTCSISAIARR